MSTSDSEDREQLDLLRRTLDALPSSIITVDRKGTVVFVNQPAEEMVPSLRPGTSLRPALEDLTNVEKVDRLLFHNEIATFPARPDGPELHWVIWEVSGPENESVLTVWETDWSEVINEQRVAFTMAASHELRGPLTTIRGFAEILNSQPESLTDEQAEAARIIEEATEQLSVLVDDVFDLTRSSFGELRLQLSPTDLAQVVESVAARLRPQIAERGQTLEVVCDSLPRIEVDEGRAVQMISNLVGNASIHNDAGTSISVSARQVGEEIAIRVSDDGRGLPFEDSQSVFRSFRRGDSTAEGDRTGSGIGVALTKLLIELHRGRITVDSEPGQGTTFTIWFPIDRDAALASGTGL